MVAEKRANEGENDLSVDVDQKDQVTQDTKVKVRVSCE
jgi:hypothetical protein